MCLFKIPTCQQVAVTCICCNESIIPDEDFAESSITIGIHTNGLVTTLFGHFKSPIEGQAYIIGICNCCLKNKIETGGITRFYNKYEDMPIEKNGKQYLEIELNTGEI